MSRFLRAGAISGASGGLVMAVVLRLLGEGPIGDAVALESHDQAMHEELYSRAAQQIGGMIGVVLYGLLVGVVFAVVLASLRHRLPFRDDWWRSMSLATIGFGTVVLVPFLKYPPNPPTVGDPSTITRRTLLYLVLLAFSVGATMLTWRFARYTSGRYARHIAVPMSVGVYVVLIGTSFAVFPPFTDEVAVPANLLWHFRLDSLAGNLALWSVLGLGLGALLSVGAVAGDDRTSVSTDG
ncbi:MAG: CbtA family protein [Actinobacteria bacterium]|nr:CbtA family protein [Actinomycetota bacterium]MBW3642552.1 CbtA family protein [Actinomycetota bacterium]